MRYTYTFTVYPSEIVWQSCKALFTVFKLLNTRVEMPFTEEEFEAFRNDLIHAGLTMRGIVRVPYYKPEVIL